MKINLEILDSAYLIDKEEIKDLDTKILVPKMVFRRRFTRSAKLVVDLLDKVNFGNGRIIYGSANGELPATANILKAILNKEFVSPTDFQNSVYNSSVSYASILKKNESEIMTISCGDNTSDRLLKMGVIKALDGDEILLIMTETLNIENIDEVNKCIDFLECAVALKVRVSQEKANITLSNEELKCPKSIEKLLKIAKECEKESKNIFEVEL